jgi:hypothetical protein
MKRSVFSIVVAVAALFLMPGQPLFAEDDVSDGPAAARGVREGWYTARTLSAQVNPLGLSLDARFFYTWPLYGKKRGVLWDNSRVDVGMYDSLTPAFYTLSAFVRAEPIAFFDVAAYAGLRGYFDNLGYGYTPLAARDASWAPGDREDAQRGTAAAARYSVAATVKGAAADFVFASSTVFTVYDMLRATGGMDYYYDPSSDTALKLFDGFLTNDSLALYTIVRDGDFFARGGVLHTFLYVPSSDYVSRRLCAALRFEADVNPAARGFLTILAGVFLQDRYNSWKDGKIYAAVQAGLTADL